MKLSIYNSYISLVGKTGLIYNAFNDSFITIKSSSNDFYKIKNGIIEGISHELYNQLKKAGAIISDNFDEVNALRKLIEKIDNDDSFLLLNINPTLDCNFHCWYCYESHIKGSFMEPTIIDRTIAFVKDRIDNQKRLKNLQLSFFGGEPLIQFNNVCIPLIEKIETLCNQFNINLFIHLTTNSYLLTEAMINFLKEFNTSFQITLDGGRDNHNRTRFSKGGPDSFNTILTNIQKLAESNIKVGIRINYTKSNIDSTSEIIDIISA